jgi:hypothetical protein
MRSFSIACGILLAACDGGASGFLDSLPPGAINPEGPPSFSAPTFLFLALSPTAFVGITGEDPACPVITRTESATTYEGGCVDEDGNEWFGRATGPAGLGTSTELPTGAIVYEGFGSDQATECPTSMDGRERTLLDGVVNITSEGGTLTFDLELMYTQSGVLEDCRVDEDMRFAAVYEGTAVAEGERTTWNGSGAIGSEVVGVFGGRFDAQTLDEVLDDTICEDEALSGRTTITGDDVATILYDGATDCDAESTATWTLNGVSQGEVSGVRCSASHGRASTLVPGAIALAMLWLSRRRRR